MEVSSKAPRKSLLVEGRIPANTDCPFAGECGINLTAKACGHLGKEHTVPYSCALARGFDMIHEMRRKLYRAVIFCDLLPKTFPFRTPEQVPTHFMSEGETPELALQNVMSVTTDVSMETTYQPSTGIIFVNGRQCGTISKYL